MRNTRVAKRYSKALMDLAVETNQVETVRKDIDFIRSAVTSELRQILLSPIVKHEKKVSIFSAVFAGKVCGLTESFFNLCFAKGREVAIVDIAEAFEESYKEMKGIQIIQLTTAVPVSEVVKEDIRSKINNMDRYKEKTLEIHEKVDESILGGFLIQVDDQLYDLSIRRDLNIIKKQFIENMYLQKLR